MELVLSLSSLNTLWHQNLNDSGETFPYGKVSRNTQRLTASEIESPSPEFLFVGLLLVPNALRHQRLNQISLVDDLLVEWVVLNALWHQRLNYWRETFPYGINSRNTQYSKALEFELVTSLEEPN